MLDESERFGDGPTEPFEAAIPQTSAVGRWFVVKCDDFGGEPASNHFYKMLAPHRVVLAGKDPVQICCAADQRQMRECLGEVAEVLAAWTNLLPGEPKMVGVSQEFFKQ